MGTIVGLILSKYIINSNGLNHIYTCDNPNGGVSSDWSEFWMSGNSFGGCVWGGEGFTCGMSMTYEWVEFVKGETTAGF